MVQLFATACKALQKCEQNALEPLPKNLYISECNLSDLVLYSTTSDIASV